MASSDKRAHRSYSGTQPMDPLNNPFQEHKDIIKKFFIDDGKPLEEVKRIMERDYGFPTCRFTTFRDRVSRTVHARKTLAPFEQDSVMYEVNRRSAKGKKSEVRLNGQVADPAKLRRWKKGYQERMARSNRKLVINPELPRGVNIITPLGSPTAIPSSGPYMPGPATPEANRPSPMLLDFPDLEHHNTSESVTEAYELATAVDFPSPRPTNITSFWGCDVLGDTAMDIESSIERHGVGLDSYGQAQQGQNVILVCGKSIAELRSSVPSSTLIQHLTNLYSRLCHESHAKITPGSGYPTMSHQDFEMLREACWFMPNRHSNPSFRVSHVLDWISIPSNRTILEEILSCDSPATFALWESIMDCVFDQKHVSAFQVLFDIGNGGEIQNDRFIRDYGRQLLECAIWLEREDNVRHLLSIGVSPCGAGFDHDEIMDPERSRESSYTPLHVAAEAVNPNIIQMLIYAGAPIAQLDGWGKSPLETLLRLDLGGEEDENEAATATGLIARRRTCCKILLHHMRQQGLSLGNRPILSAKLIDDRPLGTILHGWEKKPGAADVPPQPLLQLDRLWFANKSLYRLVYTYSPPSPSAMTVSGILEKASEAYDERDVKLYLNRHGCGSRKKDKERSGVLLEMALCMASQEGDLRTTACLLNMDVNPDIPEIESLLARRKKQQEQKKYDLVLGAADETGEDKLAVTASWSPVLRAAKQHNIPLLKLLLQSRGPRPGADLSLHNSLKAAVLGAVAHSSSPDQQAAHSSDRCIETIDFLLSNGAAENGDNFEEALLATAIPDQDSVDPDAFQPMERIYNKLLSSSHSHSPHPICISLSRPAIFPSSLSKMLTPGGPLNPLHLAIRRGCNLATACFLLHVLGNGCVHSIPCTGDGGVTRAKTTMLHDALRSRSRDRFAVADLLLRNGADARADLVLFGSCSGTKEGGGGGETAHDDGGGFSGLCTCDGGSGLTILESCLLPPPTSVSNCPEYQQQQIQMYTRLLSLGAPITTPRRCPYSSSSLLLTLLIPLSDPPPYKMIFHALDRGAAVEPLPPHRSSSCPHGPCTSFRKTPLQEACVRGDFYLARELVLRYGARVGFREEEEEEEEEGLAGGGGGGGGEGKTKRRRRGKTALQFACEGAKGKVPNRELVVLLLHLLRTTHQTSTGTGTMDDDDDDDDDNPFRGALGSAVKGASLGVVCEVLGAVLGGGRDTTTMIDWDDEEEWVDDSEKGKGKKRVVTALDYAAGKGRLDIVHLLVSVGAKCKVGGKTGFDSAIWNAEAAEGRGMMAVGRMLREMGGQYN